MQSFFVRIVPVAAVAVVLAGCGGGTDDTAELVPVSGRVTLDGEPLPGAFVRFEPTDGTGGTMSWGLTNAEGRYTLKNPRLRDGVGMGKFKVVISKQVQPDGSPIPEGQSDADVETVELLPSRYSDPASSREVVTVPEGGATFDFELQSS